MKKIKDYIYEESNYGGMGSLKKDIYLENPHNVKFDTDETVTLGGSEFYRQTGTLEMNKLREETSVKIRFVTYFTFHKGLSESDKYDDYSWFTVLCFEDTDEYRANADLLAKTVAEELCYLR